MANEELPASPAPMESDGAYNRSSRVQQAGQSPAIPLLEQAARAVELVADPSDVVSIADYGSSQGRNSLTPVSVIISALRSRVGPHRPISVAHTDLPTNDFNTLFSLLDSSADSYLKGDPATFACAVGRSFYEQVLPSGSVTLGWCSWSTQWLSRTPAPIPDHLQIAFSRDPEARREYSLQASADWQMFLRQRGRELKPGGKLVVLTMAVTDDGDFGYREVMDAMYSSVLELCERGVIDGEEAARMAIPTVGRSRQDLLEPFADGTPFAGFEVEHVDVFRGSDSIWDTYSQDDDAEAFGAKWAAFSRASVFPNLALALNCDGQDPRVALFLDGLEGAMAARLSSRPVETLIPLAMVVLTKISS